MAVLGSHEFRLRIWLGAQRGSQIRTGNENFAGGSSVLSTLGEGLEIELFDSEPENATLTGDDLWQIVMIVNRGIPTGLEVHFVCLFVPPGRILLQGSMWTNLFDPVRHLVDLRKVESQHLTPWIHQSRGWYNALRWSLHATCWTVSKSPHLLPRLLFTSSQVPFSGHLYWPSPHWRLAQVRNHIWSCENDSRPLPCSLMLHHLQIYIEYTYRILGMPVCTQLHDWIWDTEQGFLLIETGLQLRPGTGSFLASPSHSIEKLPHLTCFWCEVVESRQVEPYCIVLVVPFVRLRIVQSPLREVVEHADQHCMEEVGPREVAHETGNMWKRVECSVILARWVFGISYLEIGITERVI